MISSGKQALLACNDNEKTAVILLNFAQALLLTKEKPQSGLQNTKKMFLKNTEIHFYHSQLWHK